MIPTSLNRTFKSSAAIERPVAFLLPDLGGGGAERVALTLIRRFVERGFHVDLVLMTSSGALLPFLPDAVNVVDLNAPRARQVIMPLVRYLRARRPSALHAMMWPLPLLAIGARLLARVGTRIVISEHTTLSTLSPLLARWPVRLLTRWAYRSASAVIAVSDGVANDMVRFLGLSRKRIDLIHNPLELPSKLPFGEAAIRWWREGTRRILAVGALKSEKNYPLLLRAIQRVRAEVAMSLVIVGDGPLRPMLECEVHDLGLQDVVKFAGFAADPWPFYGAAELFVLSSDIEGFGNVLVEALHAGLAVVSTDCLSGPREILEDGRWGTLVPCADEGALATAIVERLRSPGSPRGRRRQAALLSGTSSADKHLAAMVRPDAG